MNRGNRARQCLAEGQQHQIKVQKVDFDVIRLECSGRSDFSRLPSQHPKSWHSGVGERGGADAALNGIGGVLCAAASNRPNSQASCSTLAVIPLHSQHVILWPMHVVEGRIDFACEGCQGCQSKIPHPVSSGGGSGRDKT